MEPSFPEDPHSGKNKVDGQLALGRILVDGRTTLVGKAAERL
jgi:hypothetical protein